MRAKVTVKDIQNYIEGTKFEAKFLGNMDMVIEGFCSLNAPHSNCITWIKKVSKESMSGFRECNNCLVVANEKIETNMEKICFIITNEPKKVFFSVLKQFWGRTVKYEIAQSAIIESKNISSDVCIGNNCFIDREVAIGSGTIIEHNVSICNKVRIGNNCIIHSGAVIGADGFGYYINQNGRPDKVEHFGGVYVGDNVEIGANACIDRGTIDDTVIGSNVKIDNLVHIAHNVQIGESSMVVAGAIVCGSTRLGSGSYIAPGGIIRNQLEVGKNAFVGMGAVVANSIDDNVVVAGIPARVIRNVTSEDK